MLERQNFYHQSPAHDIAEALIRLPVLHFTPCTPKTFKSGLKSPIYADCRVLLGFPEDRDTIWQSLALMVLSSRYRFDAVAGVATAGIPHATAVSRDLHLPLLSVRPEEKEHGTRQRVEGYKGKGWRVALIEDTVTTGGSVLRATEVLRAEGFFVSHVFSILQYGFPEVYTAFEKTALELHSLTDVPTIVDVCIKQGLDRFAGATLLNWYINPQKWLHN